MNSLIAQLRRRLFDAGHPVVGRSVAILLRHRIRHRGRVINTSSPRITPATISRVFWGVYEAKEVELLQAWLPPDRDVLELGASLGVVSAHIAHRLRPAQRLICVEADPGLLASIETNVVLNSAGCALIVVNQAIDYGGRPTVPMLITESNMDSRLSRDGSGLLVPATTLSRLLDQFGLDDCVVVADIEGAEVGMVLHDPAGLRRVRQLIIELHPAEQAGQTWTPEALRDQLLTVHGFVQRAQHGHVYVFERPA